jgi:hypothetical protein
MALPPLQMQQLRCVFVFVCVYACGGVNSCMHRQHTQRRSRSMSFRTHANACPHAPAHSPPCTQSGDVRYSIGTSALTYRKDHMEIEHPMKDGLIENWDLMEKLWDHALKDRLRIQPEEHPMLLAEPSFNTEACREKLLELMFEKYKVPAVFISKNAVLSAFSCGRSTAVVLDSGGGSTSATPVHEGYVLQKGLVRSPMSGEKITEYLLSVLEAKGEKIRPAYSLSKKVGKDGTVLKVRGEERGRQTSACLCQRERGRVSVRERGGGRECLCLCLCVRAQWCCWVCAASSKCQDASCDSVG